MNNIVEATKQMVPEKIKPNKLWISDNTLQPAKEKRQLKQRIRESDATRQQYKQKRRETRSAARHDNQKWMDMLCYAMLKSQYQGDVSATAQQGA